MRRHLDPAAAALEQGYGDRGGSLRRFEDARDCVRCLNRNLDGHNVGDGVGLRRGGARPRVSHWQRQERAPFEPRSAFHLRQRRGQARYPQKPAWLEA